jgi:hypothetical protein
MSFLAPQAYTKETLAKAFDWLQHQPAQITQAATTPDNLVAIYLKAQRQGIVNMDMDAPVSSKRFIDDLKSLKKDFAQFDDEPRITHTVHAEPPVQQNVQHQAQQPLQQREIHRPPPQQAYREPIPQPQSHSTRETAKETARETTREVTRELVRETPSQNLQMDERTLAAVTQIQERFNLSSPQEALRMLVSVGHQQITRWP